MGSFSIWHWLIVLLVTLLGWFIPTWKIVKKAGFNPAWSFVGFVPLLNIVMLWVFALASWPNKR